jgi:hypothetical protein
LVSTISSSLADFLPSLFRRRIACQASQCGAGKIIAAAAKKIGAQRRADPIGTEQGMKCGLLKKFRQAPGAKALHAPSVLALYPLRFASL